MKLDQIGSWSEIKLEIMKRKENRYISQTKTGD